jgi:DNA invertase Pin-like site-specific DNA recombinase
MSDSIRVVRGYGRASTEAQSLSTQQQEAVELEAFELYRKVKPEWKGATWGGFFRDEDTTRTSKFRERNSGSLILAACQPGDVIIVANYDRIFANVVDVCETLELVRSKGIRLLILDCDIDTTTDFGESVFKLLAVIKEMEVKEIRRRITEAMRYRRARGLPCAGSKIGWQTVHARHEGRNKTFWQPDFVARRLANELLRRMDEWDCNINTAFKMCNNIGLRQRNGSKWDVHDIPEVAQGRPRELSAARWFA